jgi:hypothetical protein
MFHFDYLLAIADSQSSSKGSKLAVPILFMVLLRGHDSHFNLIFMRNTGFNCDRAIYCGLVI